jgi:hypothetical protein
LRDNDCKWDNNRICYKNCSEIYNSSSCESISNCYWYNYSCTSSQGSNCAYYYTSTSCIRDSKCRWGNYCYTYNYNDDDDIDDDEEFDSDAIFFGGVIALFSFITLIVISICICCCVRKKCRRAKDASAENEDISTEDTSAKAEPRSFIC